METPSYLFTLTDCPGHASLIRTIIGGAQIIDLGLLVIDCVKGMQTQTAEVRPAPHVVDLICKGLVIASITVDALVVVLNKTDLLKPEERERKLARMIDGLRKSFAPMGFRHVAFVPFSAKVRCVRTVRPAF